MENAFLCLCLTAEKLDIVKQQNIYIGELIPEFLGLFTADSGYEIVGKLLRAHIEREQISCFQSMADSMQQVCFTGRSSPINKKWIEGYGGIAG